MSLYIVKLVIIRYTKRYRLTEGHCESTWSLKSQSHDMLCPKSRFLNSISQRTKQRESMCTSKLFKALQKYNANDSRITIRRKNSKVEKHSSKLVTNAVDWKSSSGQFVKSIHRPFLVWTKNNKWCAMNNFMSQSATSK